jgi:DNA polymerase
VADLLADIQEVLRRERELFGQELLLDNPHTHRPAEVPVANPKRVPDDEPMLFALPMAESPLPAEPWASAPTLSELEQQINTCTKCSLGRTRTKFVFGVGNPGASLMLVGEAPGADEDAQGEPFVGRAGQLLNKILEAIGFRREDVYICNILKCRPPENRKPLPEEAALCLPYLRAQVRLIKPKLILCLGLTAAENLLGTRESLSALRGRVLSYEGTPVMVTYHPAALLRNPNWKRPAWEDVQKVRKHHDELVAKQAE